MKRYFHILVITLLSFSLSAGAQETLAPLTDAGPPQTHTELWAGYDPRAEPLDIEVLKEWEQDGVVVKVIRYRIGIFKGEKAMMAAVYGYPKGGEDLPGLVNIHGGGQAANHMAVLTNAKRGYATISIAWAGRLNAPGYRVNPSVVKLFWDGKTTDPAYRVTTDWGALDAYHAPSKNGKDAFASLPKPAEWTLDTVNSPRNSSWFLCTLGARRALTFLEQQPEVDAEKLGVYGHSMGGKLTVHTAAVDSRVKAAAPSCGGYSARSDKGALYNATINDDVALVKLSCPILFQSPANDFHGRIDDLQKAVTEIKSSDWRVTSSPHHNHQDTAKYVVASQLWFDQQLKGTFKFPETPKLKVDLKTKDHTPMASLVVDPSKPIVAVEFYYSQHGQMDGLKDEIANTKSRFWHYAAATNKADVWTAALPLSAVGKPLWAFANVTYALDKPVSAAGYYYAVDTSSEFNLSSLMFMASSDELNSAGVQASAKPSLMIEAFQGDWEKEWFTYRPKEWGRLTHKVYDVQWAAPSGAKMAFKVKSEAANKMVVGIDDYAVEVDLDGGSEWQQVTLDAADFHNADGEPLGEWSGIKELRLLEKDTVRKITKGKKSILKLGGKWKGPHPEFSNLRWLKSN